MGFFDLFRSEEEKREIQRRKEAERQSRRVQYKHDLKDKIGKETIRVTSNRRVLPLVEVGEEFPLGVKGMIPVVTEYKEKGHRCYVFATQSVRRRLLDELGHVNELLDAASSLSGHEFGAINSFEFDLKDPNGWGFTRVDHRPLTRSGGVSRTPLKVRFETSVDTCSPGSYSGIIDYKRDGTMAKLEVTDWASRTKVFKVIASSVRGTMVIKSVTKLGQQADEGEVLYAAD